MLRTESWSSGEVCLPAGTPAPKEYSTFISYSHADQRCARWLHRALETYRVPKVLVGTHSPFGPVPARLPPAFRDRDELPAGGDLGEELRAALQHSRFQIVICSRLAARSKWVNEEILSFKRMHGETRTLALIVGGEPYAGDERECFPAALRFRLGQDGTLSDLPAEPIAADIRPGKDGRRLALLKLISGLLGVKLDALVRRDVARRQRRLAVIAATSMAISIITIGLAIYAESQRRLADAQRRLADKSLAFLVETFAIANPATENPRTITAITILDRASRRAKSELRDEPAATSRLLETTGEIYFNLGLPKESQRDLRASLRLTPMRGERRARLLLRLAALAFSRGDANVSAAWVDRAERAYDRNASYAPPLDALVAKSRGAIAYLTGRYAEAATLFGASATSYRNLKGDYREEIGQALMNQAQALGALKRFTEANALLGEAVRLYAAKLGTNNVLTATAVQNQALNDFESARFTRAEARIGRAVAIYDTVLEKDHPKVAAANLLLGRIRTARADSAGALSAFARARAIYAGLYGSRNPAVGDVDFYAAEAASIGGDADKALGMLNQTKEIYDRSYGPDDPDQVELLLARARIFARSGRQPESRRDCSAAEILQTKINPARSVQNALRQACAEMQTRPTSV
ncbi:toll/interleukin-1 receptor domain-containing protein [Sphingomonas qilianensis]|uniref:Toll/interleukin-1 receptor domain-containing protein n=1 Tax=Sphingomonas qilianensis TaxID=1736690 RepID=A0ABU9XSR3_9SPHN